MADFDLDAYLNNKLGAPNPGKINDILKAKEAKIAELQQFREALAQNTDSALTAQTVTDGRTWGEFGKDVALSGIQGLDTLAKIPAMVYDKATTGNFYGPETQDISRMSDEREKLKSAFAQANNKQKSQIAKDAGEAAKAYVGEGAMGTAAQVATEFGSAFWEAAKDPATLPDFLAQQAAQLGVIGKVGRTAEIGVLAAAKALPKLAATKAGQLAVANGATTAAIGTGAVLQGVDIGSDTMQRLMSLPDNVWAENPEYQALAQQLGPEAAKQSISSDLASKATLAAGAASFLSAKLMPGGSAIERVLVGKKGVGGLAAIPQAFAGEAVQEGIEESSGKLFGNTAVREINQSQQLLEGVGAAGGQGAYLGGVLGGGIKAAQTGVAAVGNIGFEQRQEEATRLEAVSAAIASGDVSALVDPKSSTYAPDQAIAALFGISQRADATPESKQAGLEQASKIVSDLEAQRDSVQDELDNTSPDRLQARLDANRDSWPAEMVDMVEEEIATLKANPADPKAVAALQKKAAKLDALIAESQDVLKVFTQESLDKNIDVAAEAAKITAADPVESQSAASRIINLSMASPDSLDTGLASSLAADASNGLTDSQRTYLRTFSEARAAENQLKRMGKVSEEIYAGSPKGAKGTRYVGLVNYRSSLATALLARNQAYADRQLELLTKFEASHQGKAQAASDALAAFQNDGINRRIEKDSSGNWSVQEGLWADNKKRVLNGGLNINANATQLVAAVKVEAAAISKTAAELQAAYEVGFSKGTTSGANNVQNVSQAPEGSETASAELQVEAAPQAGTVEGSAGATGGVAANTATNGATEAVPVATFPTWDTLQPGQQVTLYRGEGVGVGGTGNDTNGQWWTTDRAKAERYGTVTEVTLPAEVIAQNSARGDKSNNEFVFPDKRPLELAVAATQEAPSSAEETISVEQPVKPVVDETTPSASFKLNEGQQKAYDAVVKFLKSAQNTFAVIGSAGTGKTTIVKTILEQLQKEGLGQYSGNVILTAPTHRANAVTRSKNPDSEILTLHSLLGLAPDVDLDNFDAKSVNFVQREKEEPTMPQDGLLIVDESSMINDELFKALVDTAKSTNTKIIFLGDMAQLGPVKQATDSKALVSTDGQAVLSQVMRAKNAELLGESVAVRENGDFTAQNSMTQGNGVMFTNSVNSFLKRAANLFGSEQFKKNPLLVRVLAFRNDTVAKYNRQIRAAIHGDAAAPYVVGELLMGYASFGKPDAETKMAQIANGVDYQVEKVGATSKATLFGVSVEVIQLTIRDVYGLNAPSTVSVVSPLTSAEVIEKLGRAAQDVVKRAKTDRKLWKGFFAEKSKFVLPFNIAVTDKGRTNYLVAKTVDYGYAHTIHKSQGGTYTFAMVDSKDVDTARTDKEKQRLRYVGLTRAERGAFVLTSAEILDQQEASPAVEEASGSAVSTVDTAGAQAQLQSTEQSTATSEGVVPVSEEVATQEAVQPAKVVEPTSSATPVVERSEGLLALQAKSPEGTPHDEKRLGDFFTQAAGKDTDGSKRPLAAVKDFMSAVAAGTVKLAQYVKDQDLSEGAKPQVWAKFVEKAAQWAPEITRNLKAGIDQKFHYLDPIRFLQTLSVDGKTTAEVEENVKTAMSAALFSYTADRAGRVSLNNDKDINSILNRSPDSPVSVNARAKLTDVGVYQAQVIDSLGLAVMDALGFKLNPNAPQDMLAKMQVSLGGHALKLMEDQGLLVRSEITNGEMNRLRSEKLFEDSESNNQTDESDSGNQTEATSWNSDNLRGHVFFKLARDSAGQPTGQAKEIADAIKGSQSLIQNLFGIESSLTFPSLTPPKGLQKESDTGMGLPGFIKKVFRLNQTRPWKANKDPLKILSFFSEEEGIEMAGVDNATEHTHRRNLNSKRAKNDGLIREFRNFMQFVGDLAVSDKGMEQEFYLSQEMWKQQRSGYKSNAVNPNTSKIVRWLMAPDSWSTDINLNDEKQLQSFMLRVSEGFGIKPEKDASEEAVKALNSKMKEPAMQQAVKAMQAMLVLQNADATDQQRSAVLEAVKAGKQNLHTLASLIAYARYQQAVDTKADTFTTNLMGEVDGVSNGSVLNSIMYGAAATAEQLNTLLEKGGIYTLGSKFSQYNLWRGTPGHQDIYESNAQDLHAYVNSMPAETRAVTGAIWATAGSPINAAMEATKDGRDLLKGPINPLNYGGGFKSIIGKMAYNYVDTIYEKLEGFSRKGADQATVNEFVRNVNTLLSESKVPLMPVGKPIAFYLGYTLSEAQEAALRNAYSATVGVAAKEVVGKNFKAFLDRSKSVTKTVNLTYGLYEAVYNASRQAMIKELGIPTKRVRVPGSPNSKPEYTNEPIHDLTVAQEAQLAERLKDILPAMHTAMSKQEGKVENGILLAKKDRKQNNSPAYKVAVEFGSKLKNGASQLTTVGRSMVQTDPGVIAISGTTHALDSAVSHSAQEANHVLNNHDAVGAGINTLAQSAELLNKNTWSKTLNYSPLSEAHDALMRVVQGIVAMDQRGELTPDIKAAIKEKLEEIAKGTRGNNAESLVDVTAFSIFGQALQANRIKLTAMAQWAVVDQYAMDGGSYQVTAEDRQEALDRLNALSPGRSAADLQALDAFGKSLFGTGAVQATTTAPVAAAPKATVTSLFGNIGIPAIKSEDDLVTFFRSKPEATAAEVIKLLMAEGRLNSINRKILTLISRTVSPDLKIKFVTPQTSPDTVLEKPTTSARGWFIAKNGREEIYVLSPEFVDSGLTTETLLHELVHAAVARVIDNPSKEAAALVDELRSLKNEAKKYLLKNRMTGFKAALLEDRDDRKDIQEFVAWGMTDLEFQRDVLSKITMKSKTSSNRLVTGMQDFISALTGLLFKKPDANIDNGLAVLIGNVSGLFYEAAGVNNRTGSNLNLAQETVAPIDAYTTLDIHQALDNGTLEPSFQAQLGNLLTGIVDALHGPFGAFAASMRKTEAGNPLAVWLKAMETGQAPFASAIVASGFAGSAQEDFAMQQVEATVKAAIDRNEALTKIAYKQLSDLYTEVKSKLKPSDFDSQEDYDFVFKLESGNGGRSDYLARFAAMGLANQKFNSMLKFATERDTRRFGEGQTFTQRLENIFEKILAFFSEWTTRTYAGQNVDEKLEALVNQLVDIEAKKRHLIKRQATETNYLAPVEEGVKKAADAARAKVGEIAGAEIIRNNRFATVRAAGSLVRTVADDRVEGFLDGLQRFRDRNFKGRQGITAGLLTDLKGPLEKFALLLRESKRREGERKSIITQYSKQALQTFINQGKDLSKEAKAGISAVFMRTGLHNLIDTMSMADLERVISSRSELEKAITATEAQLNSRLKDRYIEQANALGYYKATGKARSSVLMLNSYLIARMSGTQFQNQVTAQEAKQVEPIIASLASLYALKYSSVQDLTQATQVLRTENNRTDGNGVEFVLKLHKQMEAESLQRLFKGNPALMVHGYTPEILNPYTAIKIADAVEGQDLLAQGYSLGAKVSQDRADPDTSGKRIYVLRDGGLAPYLTGVFSLTGLKAKGSKKHNGYMNVNTQNGLDNAVLQADITNKKLSSLQVKKDPKRDLSNDDQNHMVPVYNEMGNIVNWRYMMAEKTKNDLLERDNRFENMLGVFAGSIYDKETTQEQNLKAVTALREQFELEYATRKDSYIEVGEDSSDPEMREIWNLLPDATKQDVRKVWGRKGMKVRVDSLDLMFGYRKLSAAEFLMKDKASLEGMQKIFREWFGIYAKSRGMNEQEADNYAKKIGVMLARGEKGWQEIVSEVKDIIVVKTGVVMLGNIYSNLSFLAIAGVPVKEGLKHHLVAMKAATTYQRDTERLAQLENLLEVGYSQNNDKEIREEMVRLRDSLARNPVRELIEAGLMPTIVEDVAADEDIYSYKSLLARKTERFTDRLNPNVKAAGKFVYMAHDTKMYQSLRRITQLSDFVARYTLYQHLTSRANNPLSHADAIQEASDAFVNYDIPMHRGMQYTDDMGFTPFMKYFLRIQRVLLKLARENPARVLTTIALNSYMDLGPIVLDSSFTSNIGDNPFKAGAFQLPGALGDLATVNAGMALIK